MLTLVPTPIGNLEDITLRAIRILKEADVILAEDTRTTGLLLKHLEINNNLRSYHIFNEHKTVEGIVAQLKEGKNIALVSDAGTPSISDPGFLLVRACIEAGCEVTCLPGPTAIIPALALSGLPADRFTFEGFLPHKKGRKTKIESLAEEERTMIFYESPHRLLKTLQQLGEAWGADRPAVVCREISKLYEEVARGTLDELHAYFEEKGVKGEIVLLVGGYVIPKKSKRNQDD